MTRITTLIILNAVLFAVFLFLNTTGWPGLHWDSCLYAPTIINFSKYGTWTPGVYPYGLEGDYYPLHIHGFLSVVIFGQLLNCQDWQPLLTCMGVWNGLTSVIWFIAAYSQRKCASFGNQIESVGIGILAGVVSVNLQGRPEHPVVLISVLPLIMATYFHYQLVKVLTLGITSGIIFTCSPQSGALSAIFIIFYLGVDREFTVVRFVKNLLATGSLALLSAFTIASVTYCIPFHQWVMKLLYSGNVAADFSEHLFTFDYQAVLGVSTMSPFWNIFVIFCWSLCLFWLIRLRRSVVMIPYILLSIYLWPKLTDYGYIFTFPLCYVLLRGVVDRNLTLPLSSRSARTAKVALQGFLFSYFLTFLQFSAEAYIAISSHNSLSTQLMNYRTSAEVQFDSEDKLGEIGHCWFAGYSFVVMGDGSQKYMNAPIELPQIAFSPTLEAFTKHHKGSCRYLIFPLHLVKDKFELTISGVKYNLLSRSGEPVYLPLCLRRRSIGYAYAVYKQSPH